MNSSLLSRKHISVAYACLSKLLPTAGCSLLLPAEPTLLSKLLLRQVIGVLMQTSCHLFNFLEANGLSCMMALDQILCKKKNPTKYNLIYFQKNLSYWASSISEETDLLTTTVNMVSNKQNKRQKLSSLGEHLRVWILKFSEVMMFIFPLYWMYKVSVSVSVNCCRHKIFYGRLYTVFFTSHTR